MLLLMLYAAVADGPGGLGCEQCALTGGASCTVGLAFPTDTLIVSLVGIFASFLALCAQVSYSYIVKRVSIAPPPPVWPR